MSKPISGIQLLLKWGFVDEKEGEINS